MIFIAPLKTVFTANQLRLLAHTIAFGMETGHAVSYPEFYQNCRSFPAAPCGPMCRWVPGRDGAEAEDDDARVAPRLVQRAATGASFQAARAITFLLHRRYDRALPMRSRLLANHNWLDKLVLDDPAHADLRDPRQLLIVRGQEFRAYDSLYRHEAEIRRIFRPTRKAEAEVAAAVAPAREACDVLVGVHVRRFDYKLFHGGRYFFEFEQYVDAMRQAAGQFPGKKVGFVVCSTDKIPPEVFGELPVWPGPGSAIGDLYALAACDRVMGPPSSFNQWASFYGDAPLHWIETPDAPVRFRGYGRMEIEWVEGMVDEYRRTGKTSETGGTPPPLADDPAKRPAEPAGV